jgi:hypothetical protein
MYQNSTEITLFQDVSFQGEPFTTTNGGVISPATSFKSFFFTGPYNWEYTTTSGGQATCLNHTLGDGASYGITFSVSAELNLVNNIKLGCGDEPLPTTMMTTTGNPVSTTTMNPDFFSCNNRSDG